MILLLLPLLMILCDGAHVVGSALTRERRSLNIEDLKNSNIQALFMSTTSSGDDEDDDEGFWV